MEAPQSVGGAKAKSGNFGIKHGVLPTVLQLGSFNVNAFLRNDKHTLYNGVKYSFYKNKSCCVLGVAAIRSFNFFIISRI